MISRSPSSLKIVLWNIEWRSPSAPAGREIRCRIDAHEPDIVCITEGHEAFLGDSGHAISGAANYGVNAKPDRRKVMLWSRMPWVEVDDLGSDDLPASRYVAAATETPVGNIEVVGVCIPWSFSNVNVGTKDRTPWEDHAAYLKGLAALLPPIIARGPTIVLGDFNQTAAQSQRSSVLGRPLRLILTPGITSDVKTADQRIRDTTGLKRLIADRVYDASCIRAPFGSRI